MNSWVCASTPTVSRSMTAGRTSFAIAIEVSRSISSNESTTIRPTPAFTARMSSLADLLLPCSPIRSGGMPAASAVDSSPPVQTSSDRPSDSMIRTIALLRNALPA